MSYLRPDAMAFLNRWREVLVGLGVAVVGALILSRGGLFYGALGVVIVGLGLSLALSAWRRMRFVRDASAPGAVDVDEGAIAYFGPQTGGAVALSELSKVEAIQVGRHLCWRLRQSDGQALLIPMAATGAEVLFDSFISLPGASAEAFLAAQNTPAPEPRTIWRRGPADDPLYLPRG